MSELAGRELNGRYFLRKLIGTGGMADVYLAWDKLRATQMAVKVLRPDLFANPRFLQMFQREADLLRQLEHPNIVRLYEFETDPENEIAFLVMDWIEGTDLRDAIGQKKKPCSVEDARRLLEAICAALHYAHLNQTYHCDVKPSNVLIHVDGRILLTDFGVARLAAAEDQGGGTPAYMAPEQFLKQSVDARTDIYALGLTLYEMLSGGQLPFRGDSSPKMGSTTRDRIAWEHLNQPPPPLRQFNPALPLAIENVILTALRKKREERFPTALALREAFETAQRTSRSSRADPHPTVYEAPRVSPPPAQLPSTQPAAYLGRPHLVGRRGDLAGRVILIPQGGLTIGRARDRQLRLSEGSVSRIHATILSTRRGIFIQDEQSSLGTFVNGQQLRGPVRLKSGDIIRIGYYQELEFRET